MTIPNIDTVAILLKWISQHDRQCGPCAMKLLRACGELYKGIICDTDNILCQSCQDTFNQEAEECLQDIYNRLKK